MMFPIGVLSIVEVHEHADSEGKRATVMSFVNFNDSNLSLYITFVDHYAILADYPGERQG